jgi:predicted nucleotidyltransferase
VDLRNLRVQIDQERIAEFCRKWMVAEFSLFGSVLRENFGSESDLDVAVALASDAPWSLYEWVDMIEELQEFFGRKVHLVEQTAIRNPYRRHEILTTKQVIYAA